MCAAREIYHKHPDELTEKQHEYLHDFIGVQWFENERSKEDAK